MKRISIFSLFLCVASVASVPAWGGDDILVKRLAAKEFARLSPDVQFPEGITANPNTGEIYVGTFSFATDNKLLRFSANGKLLAERDFGAAPLLGLAFNPSDNKVYIANAGDLAGVGSKIQRIAADFDEGTGIETVADVPGIGAPADRTVGNPDGSSDTIGFGNNAAAPNDLTFRSDGALFFSDSFQGAIFRIDDAESCATSCLVETVKHDGLLATAGFPPFGANGVALNATETELFVANTGDDRVLRLDLSTGDLGVFAESVNGADGIGFDASGNLWIAANQADEMVVLDGDGRVIAKLGDFLGIREDGAVRGLLFPASLVFVGDDVFVTNLALPLTGAAGDEPEEDVTVDTIARIKVPNTL